MQSLEVRPGNFDRGYRGAYAYQPGYAYSSSYAYTPGFAYGGSYGYRSYGYDSGPRYGSSESRFAARGEFRETTRARAEVRTGTTAREQGMVRTGNRDQAVGRGSVRESGIQPGIQLRSISVYLVLVDASNLEDDAIYSRYSM